MEIDLNIDEFNRLVIDSNDNSNKFITTDTEFWNIRNYILNKFYRNNKFWEKYKGKHFKNKLDTEKTIEKELHDNFKSDMKNKVKIVCLLLGSRIVVYFFYVSLYIDEKDKLIFDFEITL